MGTANSSRQEMPAADKERAAPLYGQLMDTLRRQIETGIVREGEQLPGEKKLSEVYRVNYHTMRRAINELCERGVLYKLKGRGVFVAKAPLETIEYEMSTRDQFSANISGAGYIPRNRLLKAAEVIAPANVAAALGVGSCERVYFIDILRQVNDRPFIFSRVFLPSRRFPDLLNNIADFRSLSVIFQRYGLKPQRVWSSIKVGFPGQEEALVLDIPYNMPVLKGEHLQRAPGTGEIAYSLSCYRGDLARLCIYW